jgi:putative permease
VVTFPVLVVAWFQWGWTADFGWLALAYFIIQTLDGNVLVPLLFSEVVSLHPIAIIVAILVFGGFWGFWGVFFAIPLATLVNAVIQAWPTRKELDAKLAEQTVPS